MKKICLFILLFIPLVTQASSNIVFQCTTNNGKMISVKKLGKFYEYRFGFPNKAPELVFKNHKNKVKTYYTDRDSDLSGGFLLSSMALTNRNYIYTVYFSYRRAADEDDPDREKTGLTIDKKDDKEYFAEILCNDKKEIIINWPD